MTHVHPPSQLRNEKGLWYILGLIIFFMMVELVGSYLSGSLALLSDAAHMFTDAAGLTIALIAIQIGKKPSDQKRTFGYYRFEILAAAVNAALLFLLAFYIFYEAFQRFYHPRSVEPNIMFAIALIGLIVNIIGIRLLHAENREHLNVKAVYLEMWADMLSSLGVIVSAAVIYFTHWHYIDAITAMLISLWILPRTWTLLKESVNILLEGVPPGIDPEKIHNALMSLASVTDVHELHIWALTNNKISLTVHLITNRPMEEAEILLHDATKLLEQDFSIIHTTIQIESVKCERESIHI